MSEWVVIKFGGTSVSSLEYWDKITQIVRAHSKKGRRILIVCSAVSGISRLLNELIESALLDQYQRPLSTIKNTYTALAKELGVSQEVIKADFIVLERLIEGVALLKEASPKSRAQLLAFGELLLTRLGHEFLNQSGISSAWLDIRTALKTITEPHAHPTKHYLAGQCDAEEDPSFQKSLNAFDERVVITQGFIGSDCNGDTVLLGWGGSDISAAYAAAKLNATRCEIWTDVPGIYTANPHQIPQARLLTHLDYDEAQEIAAMGAKVLHPKTIPPIKKAKIPLYIKCTSHPDLEGTVMTHKSESSGLLIKSILTKYHITVITLETISMWHQSGFLADIFNCFKSHDLSIDLITTSESSVTVTLDNTGRLIDDQRIGALTTELSEFCNVTVQAPCAQVTLVGRHLRSILHEFAAVFEVFESQQVHMLSQSSNDLNLSFVVNEDVAEKIAKKLHVLLIDNNPESYHYSKTWQEEFSNLAPIAKPWWETDSGALLTLAESSSPCYVYDKSALTHAADNLIACDTVDSIFFAMKANPHPDVLTVFYNKGLGFECVSIEELECIFKLFPDIDPNRVLFTPNFAPKKEYEKAFECGVHVTVDALYPLEHWPDTFKGQSVLLRVDPGVGLGHHKYVSTGGNASKFGIPQSRIPDVVKIIDQYDITVIGLHAHYGSGILQPNLWENTALMLSNLLAHFKDVKILDLGGGLGIVERPGQRPLDTQKLNESLKPIKEKFPELQFWLEPGRYLVARAGIILAKVTQIKQKEGTQFVGIETGMNSLIRPALYGSYHEIINLTRHQEPTSMVAHIVGPICESGDTLGFSRHLPSTKEGDVILIANTGAYGFCMSSRYNLREPAKEYII